MDRETDALACHTRIESDMTVILPSKESRVLTLGTRNTYETDGEKGLGLAMDIGTTTVAAYLMDMESGRELARTARLNPQRIHGADVITRLNYCLQNTENQLRLKTEIDALKNEIGDELLKKAGIEAPLTACALVGNTVMMHLAGGYDAKGLAAAPFTPFYTQLHITHCAGTPAFFGGCISGYVGADTVAAMLACDMDIRPQTQLLIDIGTNGEIVLKHKGNYTCCSCAAGPAFEGAHISCGTGAVPGAIDHIDPDGSFTTIDNAPVAGICGSGIVDAISYLVENEQISPVGRMREPFVISPEVSIIPADIREVQLAKAAISAGIEILVNDAGIDFKDIDRVYLAGGFGSYIRIPSACSIGMLPYQIADKILPVGNAAGDGAKMILLSKNARDRAEQMRSQTRYIELSSQPEFEDCYADHLIFSNE